ncbi:hypothetical protein ACWFR4_45865, partial [Streptomyces sp. NPDC055140]
IPVIDCRSQVLAPPTAPRLKLIAPKRWRKGSDTIRAALGALTPTGAGMEPEHRTCGSDHFAHPLGTPPQ